MNNEQRELHQRMRNAGLSLRTIARVSGSTLAAVASDCKSVPNPERVIGVDGRLYTVRETNADTVAIDPGPHGLAS